MVGLATFNCIFGTLLEFGHDESVQNNTCLVEDALFSEVLFAGFDITISLAGVIALRIAYSMMLESQSMKIMRIGWSTYPGF